MLRHSPDAFIHSMVTAATFRPFWTTLMEMKQARLRVARLVSAPVPAHELESLESVDAFIATSQAA